MEISLSRDTVLNIQLENENSDLSEVVIRASAKGRSIGGEQMGVEHLSIKEIKNIPVLPGERDALKVMQLLPV